MLLLSEKRLFLTLAVTKKVLSFVRHEFYVIRNVRIRINYSGQVDPRVRIRIYYYQMWIPGSGYTIPNIDPRIRIY